MTARRSLHLSAQRRAFAAALCIGPALALAQAPRSDDWRELPALARLGYETITLPGGEQLAVISERARLSQESQSAEFPSPRDPGVPISIEASPLFDGPTIAGTVVVLRVPPLLLPVAARLPPMPSAARWRVLTSLPTPWV